MRVNLKILTGEDFELIVAALDVYDGQLLAELDTKYISEHDTREKRQRIANLQETLRDMADDERFGITNYVTVAPSKQLDD